MEQKILHKLFHIYNFAAVNPREEPEGSGSRWRRGTEQGAAGLHGDQPRSGQLSSWAVSAEASAAWSGDEPRRTRASITAAAQEARSIMAPHKGLRSALSHSNEQRRAAPQSL